jgi:hypothetical protein
MKSWRKCIVTGTFYCFLLPVYLYSQTNLFVSVTNGNDATNNGTLEAPFKTLVRAKQQVQAVKQSATAPITGPINVYLRAGTYYLDSTLVFGTADGGTATAPITYSAFRGEKVVISGGIKVTTQWTTSSGNIMVTTLAPNLKVDQLFLNGKRQILARYPNYDSTKILQGYATDCISSTRVARWANVAEGPGYIRAIDGRLWGATDYIMTGKNGTTLNYTWVGDNNRGNQMHVQYRMVENLFEELDAPGEWFYRKSTGQLFFYPPAGVNPNNALIELASVEQLFKVLGTASNKVKYLTFNRLTFTQTHRTLFTGHFEGLLRGDYCIVRAGTVFIQDAENITIKHCFFDQIGGNGVFMNAYNRNNRVYNCEFVDAGASCVLTVGLMSAVRTPSTWQQGVNPIADNTPGPLTQDYPENIVVDNNLMKNLGVFEKQTTGVFISMSHKVTVRHNTIFTSPRSVININEGTWGGHDIEYNNGYDCVRETGDHGPFNSWGRDRFWGTSQTNTTTAALDAIDVTTIHNNRFVCYNKDGWWTIDLDDGSSYYTIYNNLMLETGLKLREGFRRKAYNNIIIVGRIGCHAWYGSCYDSVYSNIIVPSPDFTTNGNQNAYDVQAMTLSSGNKCYIDNNLFWNKSGGGVDYSPTKNAGFDAHSKIADPKFTNAAAGDYRVAENSPALALGFVNFPMDSFGRMNVVPDTMQPENVAVASAQIKNLSKIRWTKDINGFTVRYALADREKVSFELYSINGKRIASLTNSWEEPGAHKYSINTKKLQAFGLARNIYMVKMVAGKYSETRNLILTDK